MNKPDFLDKNVEPRVIESYFRDLIKATFGDKVENAADIFSTRGSYHVFFAVDGSGFAFDFKRKSAERVAKAIKALK